MDSLLKKFQLDSAECKAKISEHHIQEIAHKCCKHWKKLWPYLQLSGIMDDIDHNFTEAEDKRRGFLQKWQEQKASEATYFELIKALQAIESNADAECVCALLQKQKLSKTIDGAEPQVLDSCSPKQGTGESTSNDGSINVPSKTVWLSHSAGGGLRIWPVAIAKLLFKIP